MIDASFFIHYSTIALTVAINTLGAALGGGIVMYAALNALNIQPQAKAEITKISLLGLAILDTAAIMGCSMAFIILASSTVPTGYAGIAELGITFAICLPGFIIGLVSALPAYQACLSVARQPFFSQKILRFMLITQSLIQTPIVFGFIIAMFIKNQIVDGITLAQALKLIASGLCIGLGSIGPAIGMAHFAYTACRGIGRNRNAYNKLMSFTFISEAIIETPIIFAFVVSILVLFSEQHDNLLTGLALLSAAICTGLGTIGPGIGSGRVAAGACSQIALHPEQYSLLSRLSMVGQGLVDSSAIYAFGISIMLIMLR